MDKLQKTKMQIVAFRSGMMQKFGSFQKEADLGDWAVPTAAGVGGLGLGTLLGSYLADRGKAPQESPYIEEEAGGQEITPEQYYQYLALLQQNPYLMYQQ